MTNEEINNFINNLIELIRNQNFQGTTEEIQLQQILFFDKYVKENIEYGFDAVNYSITNPGLSNPYDSAFRLEGFFKENEINGRRIAVCGSISQVAKIIFNKLGINCDYIWGHFNVGSEEKPQYVGHRWNIVTIGDKQFMVDFTAGMIIHNISRSNEYFNCSSKILGITSSEGEYDFLFFDKLEEKETIGGFKKNTNGTAIDDLDSQGFLKNSTNNPYEAFPNLRAIKPDFIQDYIPKECGKTL